MYGTSKRTVTHFTQALAQESAERGTGVLVGLISPGIMKNDKNNAKIEWLTSGKAAWRFMTAGFNKRNFFE